MNAKHFWLWLGLGSFLLVQAVGFAQERTAKKPARALPPRWTKEVQDTFANDAREKLKGERPPLGPGTGGKKTAVAATSGTPMPAGSATTDAPAAEGVFAWSKLISPEVIEDEIKAQKPLVDLSVTTPAPFKGGTNRDARRQFSNLAMLFAIIAEYDGEVRWKKDAPGLRELFAQAGFSCKVGTDQSYNQSRLRQTDLTDLLGGSTPASVAAADPKAVWDKVTNRPPLMERLEEGFDKKLLPWLASEGAFKENNEKILHEAQIVAVIAEVIQREGYEFADDDTYLGLAKAMRDAALGIADGVKNNNYSKANESAGVITKACSECHEGYRS
jgi:hypothetical protein